MGSGENKITLWNIEHGDIIATIDLMLSIEHPKMLWAKSDRVTPVILNNLKK